MTQPKFSSQISLGNWLTMAALLASVGVGWGVMQSQNQANQLALTEVKASQADLEVRIRKLETSNAVADERFNSMLQLLKRIDSRLERIENAQ